ncbi:MAG: hypothetical protein QNJ31_04825 [Candidatus Caenarcaniphilales bacterium]|nr:hypothetical protein [Candidatus Caenarcaniphilales bacterium]
MSLPNIAFILILGFCFLAWQLYTELFHEQSSSKNYAFYQNLLKKISREITNKFTQKDTTKESQNQHNEGKFFSIRTVISKEKTTDSISNEEEPEFSKATLRKQRTIASQEKVFKKEQPEIRKEIENNENKNSSSRQNKFIQKYFKEKETDTQNLRITKKYPINSNRLVNQKNKINILKDSTISQSNFNPQTNEELNEKLLETRIDLSKTNSSQDIRSTRPNVTTNFMENFVSENKKTFFPFLEIQYPVIHRNKELNYIKSHFHKNNFLFLIGENGIGKSYLASLYAKDMFNINESNVLSFSFDQSINSLNDGLKIILTEQCGLSPISIEDPLQTFTQILNNEEFIVLLNNIELINKNDLIKLLNSNVICSKLILISSTLSANSICRLDNNFKRNILEIISINNQEVKNFFLEKVSIGFKASPALVSDLFEFTKGSPFNLILFCSLLEKLIEQNNNLSLEEAFQLIFSSKKHLDKNSSNYLPQLISYFLEHLTQSEKQILLFCSYIPINIFSNSLIQFIFNLSENECVQTLNSLKNSGLIRKVFSKPYQEPCFAVHNLVKEFIYKEKSIASLNFEELVPKMAFYLLEVLRDDKRVQNENTIFLVSALDYCVSQLNVNFDERAQLLPIFEKTIDYFCSIGLKHKVQSEIVSIFRDNLEKSQAPTVKAFWTRLLGLCSLVLAKGNEFNDAERNSQYIHEGISLLNSSLEIFQKNFNFLEEQKTYNDLGNAYLTLSEEELTEDNLIKAVEYFKKTIKLQSSMKMTLQNVNSIKPNNNSVMNSSTFVLSHISLGNSYMKLYSVKPSALTLHLASQILIKSIQEFRKELPNSILSSVHRNIADAFRLLADHEETVANLCTAIDSYKESLIGVNEEIKPLIFNSIGCCFWKMSKVKDTSKNIEQAIAFYRKTLSCLINQHSSTAKESIECAVTLNNLGIAYKTLSQLKDPNSNRSLAFIAFREALSIAEKKEDYEIINTIKKQLNEMYQGEKQTEDSKQLSSQLSNYPLLNEKSNLDS